MYEACEKRRSIPGGSQVTLEAGDKPVVRKGEGLKQLDFLRKGEKK